MPPPTGFRLPRLCLPRPGIDLARWAVVACDQYTSEPDYWQRVERRVGDAPSTLHLTFPEVYLEAPDAAARIGRIQQAMADYERRGLFAEHDGAVLVERTVDGRTRRGLMLELDLEHYDFSPESTSLIRPTEGTIVARLAPRIAVRRGAPLELPHILVLIDDPGHTVIEPVAAARGALTRLYDTELMEGGGHVAGHAVDAARGARVVQALTALAAPAVFEARHGVAPGTPPMLFAMGDGNHSLATAKSIWDELKTSARPDHPARFALVEVVNIHDPALHFAPIHRVLFGLRADPRAALAEALAGRLALTETADATALRARVQARRRRRAGAAAGLRPHRSGRALHGGRDRITAIAAGGRHAAAGARPAGGAGRCGEHRLRARRRRRRAPRPAAGLHRLSPRRTGQARTADAGGARRPAAAQDLLDGRGAREALLHGGAAHPLTAARRRGHGQ
jgi:hypothetical protein